MLTFVSAKYAQLLRNNQLDTFEKVWSRKVDWFEEPNERRGGWSGVGRIVIEQDNQTFGAFLKRQDKHCRTSWRHPVHGVPTFQREFEMMRYLEVHGVLAPEVMLFGRNPNGDLKTTLLTKELAGFVPLEELTESLILLVAENGMDWMYANCSTTAQRGALDWKNKFRDAVAPVFEELYDSVASGEEAQRSIDTNSQPDYREKLDAELKELRDSEMWQAGAQVRKLRPQNN